MFQQNYQLGLAPVDAVDPALIGLTVICALPVWPAGVLALSVTSTTTLGGWLAQLI